MDPLRALQSVGLTLPSPAYIAGMFAFGIIGMVAWYRGRRTHRPRIKWLGLALMLYPYAVWNTWLLYGVGVLLCVGLFIGHD